jgi:hypothetical protein
VCCVRKLAVRVRVLAVGCEECGTRRGPRHPATGPTRTYSLTTDRLDEAKSLLNLE